jgi:DNA-binding transcriptional LysR family regulator
MAVAEEQSFTRAAGKLHISQPPLSVQIKALEQDLGVGLFERTNRGVVLTAAGQVYYEEARAILERLGQAKTAAQRAARGQAGSLSIGFVSIADFTLLPGVLKQFRERYPDVELHLLEETTNVQVQELKADRLDLGIALAPVDDAEVTFTPLFEESLLLAVPSEMSRSPVRLSRRPSLAAFRDHPFVLFPRPMAPGLFDAVQAYCAAAGFTPRILQYARQMQTIVSIVSTGVGISLVPSSLKNLQRPGVTYLRPREPSPRIGLGLIARRGALNAVTTNFMKIALEEGRSWARGR